MARQPASRFIFAELEPPPTSIASRTRSFWPICLKLLQIVVLDLLYKIPKRHRRTRLRSGSSTPSKIVVAEPPPPGTLIVSRTRSFCSICFKFTQMVVLDLLYNIPDRRPPTRFPSGPSTPSKIDVVKLCPPVNLSASQIHSFQPIVIQTELEVLQTELYNFHNP